MRTIVPSPLLKFALLADAAGSGMSAAVQLTAPGALSDAMQLPRMLLVETGVFLVAYALLLVAVAYSPRVPSAVISAIVLGNIGWAIGCIALLVTGTLSPSSLGIAFVIGHVLFVLVAATFEYNGLKSSGRVHAMAAAPSH